jgi:hypothetical protein
MGQRQTRKTGIQQGRTDNLQLNRMLGAIIERLEVLDGVRGDALDRAVTLRDLSDSGFKVTVNPVGTGGVTPPVVAPPPDSGDGPGIGPTTPATDLTVDETYLALKVKWNNPSFNLQHIEVWRQTFDQGRVFDTNVAVQIGITTGTQYMDYVGANQTFYYWVRAVSTDGTKTAYTGNDPTDATFPGPLYGAEGVTGVDPGQILLDPTNFQLQDGVDVVAPFLVGEIDGEPAVGLSGQFIVDGTIRASSIVTASLGAREINAESLSAISGNMGTLVAGLLTTAGKFVTNVFGTPLYTTDENAWRVEIQDQTATQWPIWYGYGPKSAGSDARFYIDKNGNVTVKGLLDAGMIAQSFFAPSTTENNSFRIACEYWDNPASYSGGVYSGKAAHILPTILKSQTATHSFWYDPLAGFPRIYNTYTSSTVTLYSPTYSAANIQYGRLGSNAELILVEVTATMYADSWQTISTMPDDFVRIAAFKTHDVYVEYKYDLDADWSVLSKNKLSIYGSSGATYKFLVCSRADDFDTLTFRYRIVPTSTGEPKDGLGNVYAWNLINSSIEVSSPNFGYSDRTFATLDRAEITTAPLNIEELEQKATNTPNGVIRLPAFVDTVPPDIIL